MTMFPIVTSLADPASLARMDRDELRTALRPLWEDAEPLAARLVGRNFATWEQVIDEAEAEIADMTDEVRSRLLRGHPRLGATPSGLRARSEFSWREQGGADSRAAAVTARLQQLNASYDGKFGFPFVEWVAGRPLALIVPILEARLERDRRTELLTGCDALVAIARDRLRHAVSLDAPRLLERLRQLARIGGGDDGSVTRLAWTPEDREAVALVARWAREANAEVRTDEAGNLLVERPGSRPDLPPLVTGSHLDTVVRGGALDGAYGVVAGVEVLAALEGAAVTTRHPVRVVAFVNEEGVHSPPFTGSRAVAGALRPEELGVTGTDAMALAQRMRGAGSDPDHLARAAWTPSIAAMVELHVEQGPALEQAGVPIGVVTAIAAQQRGSIVITGQANHAGTTPMVARRDALVAAARTVLAVQEVALAGPAEVATVGRIQIHPGAVNVVAGQAELSFDIRAVTESQAADALSQLHQMVSAIERDSGCAIDLKPLPPTRGVATDPVLRRLIADAAQALGLPILALASSAGHDYAILTGLGPIAMIFVPSAGGISHSPAESTPDGDLIAGATVLLDTMLRADIALDGEADDGQ